MKRTKMPVLLSALLMAALLSGCSQSGQDSSQRTKTEGLDQVKEIQVISREEGSGTRSAFAELVGFVGNEEGKQDLTKTKRKLQKMRRKCANWWAKIHRLSAIFLLELCRRTAG